MSQCDRNPSQKRLTACSSRRKLFSAITYHEVLPVSAVQNTEVGENSVLPWSVVPITQTVKRHPVRKNESFSIQVSPYTCNICSKTLRSKNNLERHLLTHQYKSVLCGKSFKNKKNVLPTEKKLNNLVCKDCGKEFRRKENLHVHMYQHRYYKSHNCKICNKFFSSSTSLERHQYTHSEKKQCSDTCNKDYSHLNGVKIPKLTTNSPPSVENYPCPVCSRTFKYHKLWKIHLVAHTGEKPYACDICNKCFSYKGNLDRHFKAHNYPYF